METNLEKNEKVILSVYLPLNQTNNTQIISICSKSPERTLESNCSIYSQWRLNSEEMCETLQKILSNFVQISGFKYFLKIV